MNPSKSAKDPFEQLARARMIQRTLGIRVATRYMQLRQWSAESVVWWLLDPNSRRSRRGRAG